MKVMCIKTNSGLDLIGRTEGMDENGTYRFSKVMQVHPHHTQQGIQVALLPFIMFAEHEGDVDELLFGLEQYLVVYQPKSDLENAYVEQTSGIALAPQRPFGRPTAVKG